MPVRIYEIAKRLGMENKEVLVKAKALGIAAAKVPSSTLDKITAEYLEEQLGGVRPKPEAPPTPAPAPASAPEPVINTSAAASPEPTKAAEPGAPSTPSEAPKAAAPTVPSLSSPPAETPESVDARPPESATVPSISEPQAPVVVESAAAPVEAVPPAPPKPETPGIGAKVGFVHLPPKPGPRVGDKVGSVKLPPKPAPRQEFQRGRPDNRFGQRAPQPQTGYQRPAAPGARAPMPGQRQDSGKPVPPTEPQFVPPAGGELIILKPPIIVRDLAEKLRKKPFQLIADLMHLNVFANVNQAIDELVAQKLAAKYGFRFEVEKRERGGGIVHAPIRKVELDTEDKIEELKPRAPVVTIMGHVDHGKTTLLDVIRKANVAAGEAGGITQHIGAYTISVPHPEKPAVLTQITFLDTPGHAAFSSMRARGANVTDIVVLVVAANDGVMPQTLEALSHAKAAKVPIIVAVNKIDHPHANPVRVRQQLAEKGLNPDDWGGDTIYVDVSALTKQGIDKLLEMIVFQADLLELKANPIRRAKGNVIESGLEPGGPTATVLVRKGTLRVGDVVICGAYYGKVRAIINEEDKRLKEAGPSVAVKLLGLNGIPEAGIEFSAVENEKAARDLAEERRLAAKGQEKERRPKVTLENLFDTLASESHKVLRVVVKADTQGSVEAIVEAIRKIESDKVSLDIVHSAVGTITKEDIGLASAPPQAVVLGFHTRVDNNVSDLAKHEGVQIKLYAIIYELIDQVKDAMSGLLDPLLKEVVIGSAEVRKLFELSKGGNVAGCAVTSGRIVRGKMRVMRRKSLIYEGVSLTLRRFQDEVNEVRAGMECGIRLDGFNDFQLGDTIECYTFEKVAQKL
ncbi:MAG: translation initiation factor IF-2 [Pedosphaera sp.]|nr:translation initiation factor IF-2 [Pedosphaera sp.]